MPGFLQRSGGKVTTERLGFDLNEKSFIPDAKHINVPTLVVQNKNDPWTKMEMVQEYYDALTVEKDLKILDIERSRFAAYDYIGREPQGLFEWFDRHMATAN
ncbi:MAG: hypothetical protein AAF468_19440 [Pseudomonadota bacterium]